MFIEHAMRGWSGLALAYGAVQGPMLAGLIHGRARFSKLLLSPVLAAPLTVATGIAMVVDVQVPVDVADVSTGARLDEADWHDRI